MSKLSMNWVQTAWHSVKGQRDKKPWCWTGTRSDNRTFKLVFIPHIGYVAHTFNGNKVGQGKTLAEAQKLCHDYIGVQLKVAKESATPSR